MLLERGVFPDYSLTEVKDGPGAAAQDERPDNNR